MPSSLDCQLHLLQGRNFSVKDRTTSDPFVRIYLGTLADEDDYLFQSRSKSQTIHPKFNEKFRHTITEPDVVERVMNKEQDACFVLKIYDEDGMHGEDAMGYVQVPIVVATSTGSDNEPAIGQWYPVQDGQGELQVKLQVTVVD